jgi:RNA polymerase sigma-70 factor (ECF subfamily)
MTGITLAELVTAHQRELLVHCYRMLGSLSDAEEVLQEIWLAAWNGLDDFDHRSSMRTWLYRIATNRCLNWRRDRARRTPPEPVPPFAPPNPDTRDAVRWLEPIPDQMLQGLPDTAPGPEARFTSRESIELAFVETLQHLTSHQTAVLLLTDVLGYRRAEVAAMLDLTPAAVKGLLQRARATVIGLRACGAAPPAPGSVVESRLVHRFAEAFVADDVAALVSLLTDDAWLSMPPAPHRYRGRASIATFLRASAAWRTAAGLDLRVEPLRANGQPAFVCLHLGHGVAEPAGLIVLTLAGDRISQVTRFLQLPQKD